MVKTFFKALGLLVLAGVIAIGIAYYHWRDNRLDEIAADSRVAETTAGSIQYSLTGDEGPVILFLHGTPGGFDHEPFFVADVPTGYRWLKPSRPGYLQTPLAVGRTPAEQARAYAALLDTLAIEQVIVMGISGGGPSAVSFAAMYPEKTRALVGLEILTHPIDEPLSIPGMMKSNFFYWLGLGAIGSMNNGETLLNMFQLPAADNAAVLNSPDGLDRTRAMAWAGWPAVDRVPGWENDSAQFMALDLPLENVQAPTLVLQGTDDIQVSYERTREMVTRIPNARLYTVEGGTHAMPLTHKDELAAVINDFLNEEVF